MTGGHLNKVASLRSKILSFFDGLEIVPPGVVAVWIWNGDGPALDVRASTATFTGGVTRKS